MEPEVVWVPRAVWAPLGTKGCMPACLGGVGILGNQRIHWEKPLEYPFHFPETKGLQGEG